MRIRKLVKILGLIISMKVAFVAQNMSHDETKQYKKDVQDIQDLSRKKDLGGLIKLKDDIADRWKGKTEIYALLTSDICKSLNSNKFDDDKQFLYARQCAKQLLKDADKISVDLEREMVAILQEIEEYRLGVVSNKDWMKDRAERVKFLFHLVKFLFHLWNRVEKNIDRSFDFNDAQNRPVSKVCVPAPNYSCGIRPEDVKETAVRAKYIEAIEANTAKAKKYNLQLQLHRLDKRMTEFIDQFLIGVYGTPPFDFDELERNLDLFGIKDERKNRILEAVASF